MSSDLDTYDRDYYAGQFNRSVFLYENARPWRVLHRTVLMARVRKSAADFVSVGGRPCMPPSAREEFYECWADGWGREFHRGWSFHLTVTAIAVMVVAAFLVAFAIILSEPPRPLPAGIHQRGYSFIIPADYATGKTYDDAKASDLCDRLPIWAQSRKNGHGDWFTTKSNTDGSITLRCVLNPKRDD